ncbi:ATP-binding protein [Minwuia thermotolerans]|uniref:histidine kinase n=1 Tax=Minwuia thermotolerans TaxID=2056226 RepID=A0A2M9G0T5_9PROT|nr:ATP-binding protein [Minwuia thermotolerans]PJK29284.1 hypothetical protein CVT23_12900 [Minwuia thermotolerans]
MTTRKTVTPEPGTDSERLIDLFERAGRFGAWRIDLPDRRFRPIRGIFQLLGDVRLDRDLPVDDVLAQFGRADREALRQGLDRLVADGARLSHETALIERNGRPLAVVVEALPEFGPDGAVSGVVGITRDVTERVLAERERARAEARLRGVFDALDRSGVGIGAIDAAGRVTMARPALLSLTGHRSEAEVLGRRWVDLQGPGGRADLEAALGALDAGAAGGELGDVEWLRPDGRRLHLAVRLAPSLGGGRVISLVDQSEQYAAREESRARESRTRAILDAIDAAGIGFCVEDHAGGIFAVSPRLAELFGVGRDEDLLGRRWKDVLDLPQEVRTLSDEEDRAHAAGRPRPVVYPAFELRRRDGAVARLHARSTPLPGIGRLLLVLDETERWRMERRQAEVDRHLQRVQKLEAVGQLAGGVAHEINNLLHPIRTFARAAAAAGDAADRDRYLARVRECADKARDIVREMLSFARGSEGQMAPAPLGALVADSVAFSRDLPLRGVEIELDLPDEEIVATVNETEFTQVLLNLLTNAADAMADRGIVRVQLSAVDLTEGARPGAAAGRYARIAVSDDGPGMSREVLDRIFEPFFTTKEPGKGTGLGLSVVYGIIHRWGGLIEVESAPGRGASVIILLPAADGS